MSEATPGTGAPMMTIRVSHDGGKTWDRTREYRPGQNLPPLISGEWPLCLCPRCRGNNS
jgi:hypothetical protein